LHPKDPWRYYGPPSPAAIAATIDRTGGLLWDPATQAEHHPASDTHWYSVAGQ